MGNHKDKHPQDDPQPDENWLDDRYPLVDADFVGETLERVIHDRCQIENEAACVEEISFDPDQLNLYSVPEPDPDFVETTLSQVLTEAADGRRFADDAAYEFHRLLESSQVPEPSADFVESTFRLVNDDRARIRPAAASPAPIPISRGRRFSLIASAAAILLCIPLVFLNNEPGPKPVEPGFRMVVKPVNWASLITESEAKNKLPNPFNLPLVNHDFLVATAGIRK